MAVGILYERRHTREISDFGGLSATLPWFAALFMIACLSSIGLPGLNGFIGEFLILLGAFRAWPLVSAIAALGVILAAVYILWMYQRVMFGPITNEKNRGLSDISKREFWTLVPVIFFMIWIGVYPNTFLRKLDVSVSELLARAQARTISMRTAPLLTPASPAAARVAPAATSAPLERTP